MDDLFEAQREAIEHLMPGLTVLPAFADTPPLLDTLETLAQQAPFRQQTTPGGRTIEVATTNCGTLGWVSDERGYRYASRDPGSGQPWPAMPASWSALAARAAMAAGYEGFDPNACLVNRYLPDQRLTAHQDKNERDFSQPVVTCSIGLSASFSVHGPERGGRAQRLTLRDGDMLIMGGPARLYYHSVDRVHPDPAARRPYRISLTFRMA